MGGGGQRVVGLELDHGPDHDAGGGERLLQRMELRHQRAVDALAGLVARPELVAERLDDVVGGDADVGGAALDHPEHGVHHAARRGERRLGARGGALPAVEMPEQLVGAVDQVDDHGNSMPRRLWCGKCVPPMAPKSSDTSVRGLSEGEAQVMESLATEGRGDDVAPVVVHQPHRHLHV